jgi:hypothetical protein
MIRIIDRIVGKNEELEFPYNVRFFMNRFPVKLALLPAREATEEERRKMLGSMTTLYEMRIPILYSPEFNRFFITNYYKQTAVVFEKETELILLKTERKLRSIFDIKRKKEQQDWNSSIDIPIVRLIDPQGTPNILVSLNYARTFCNANQNWRWVTEDVKDGNL